MERVVSVASKAEIAATAAGEGSRARVLSPQLDRVRYLVCLDVASPLLRAHLLAVEVARLIEVCVLLHQLLGMQIP